MTGTTCRNAARTRGRPALAALLALLLALALAPAGAAPALAEDAGGQLAAASVQQYSASVEEGVEYGYVSLSAPPGKSLSALAEGDVVTVRPSPASGYAPARVWYREAGADAEVPVGDAGNSWSFAMPAADVAVGAEFAVPARIPASGFCEGSGTAEDPWRIPDAATLEALADAVNGYESYAGEHFALTADVDLSASGAWAPIGMAPAGVALEGVARPFRGTFDGAGHAVTGLDCEGDVAGLFGFAGEGAVIRDLSVSGTVRANTKGSNAQERGYAAGVCAYAEGALLEGCENRAAVSVAGGGRVDGLAGIVAKARDCRFEGCSNRGAVDGLGGYGGSGRIAANAGGIAAVALACGFERCSNSAAVTGGKAGGVLGAANGGTSTLASCSNRGDVSSNARSGRAAGIASCGSTSGSALSVSDCYNLGAVAASAEGGGSLSEPAAGGITASWGDNVSVVRCYNAGTVAKEWDGGHGEAQFGEIAPDRVSAGNSMTGSWTVTDPTFGSYEGNLKAAQVAELGPAGAAAALGEAYKECVNLTNPGNAPLLAWEDDPVAISSLSFSVTGAPAYAVRVCGPDGAELAPSAGGAYEVANGRYSYEVTAEGFASEAGSVDVAGSDVAVAVALRRLVSVSLSADPASAALSVTRGGEVVEPAADGRWLLAEGREYAYTASAEGYVARAGRFEATDGLAIAVSLEREDSFDGVLHGGETVTESGRYLLAEGATGPVAFGEDLNVEVVGTSFDPATGSFGGPVYRDLTLRVGDGTALTLRDARVEMTATDGGTSFVAVDVLGSCRLSVEGTCLLDRPALYDSCSMIHVPEGSSVTLGGSGTMYGYKHAKGAFIGASGGESNGDITFESGTWLLKGSKTGPIIGTDAAAGGKVTVNGGEIYLKTVSQGAAIGGSKQGSGLDVVVNGGMLQILTDFAGSAVGYGGDKGSAGTLTVNGGSLMTIVTPNAFSSWGYGDRAASEGPLVTAANVTAACSTAPLRVPTAAVAGRASITVTVDGKAFYEGAPRYAWVTNEAKEPSDFEPSTLSNWYPNDAAYLVPEGDPYTAQDKAPTAGKSRFAGESALYLWLAKGSDHEVVVAGETFYKATWDEGSQSFSLAADEEAQAAHDAEKAAAEKAAAEKAAAEKAAAEKAAAEKAAREAAAKAAAEKAAAEKAAAAKAAASKRTPIAGASVTVAGATYTGRALRPAVTVKLGSGVLRAGTDYDVSYSNNVAASSKARVTVTGKGAYEGSVSKAFAIAKAANTVTAKGKTVTVKLSKVRKKAQTVKASKAFTVKKARGKVAYKVAKWGKSAKKYVRVSKAGKVTVRKGAKKGTYAVKVKVTAAGDANHKAKSKTVTLKVRVK